MTAACGESQSRVRGILRTIGPGASVGAPGVAGLRVSSAPDQADVERRLLALLDLPKRTFEHDCLRTVIVFDAFQDVVSAGRGVDGVIRSRIQHHGRCARTSSLARTPRRSLSCSMTEPGPCTGSGAVDAASSRRTRSASTSRTASRAAIAIRVWRWSCCSTTAVDILSGRCCGAGDIDALGLSLVRGV